MIAQKLRVTSPRQDYSAENWATWVPEVGTQVVYIYPAEWLMPDLYGEVLSFDADDDVFYVLEATLGRRKIVDYDNMLKHGASLRPMGSKEKYPLPKSTLSAAEKRAIAAKKKKALQ